MAIVEPDLLEWNYGEYEGRTSADIHAERPDWDLFRDGCPGVESPEQIGARADRAIRRVRGIGGDTLLFSSSHFLRIFAARWLGLDPGAGRLFVLGTASLSVMGYEHNRSEPVIRLWGEMGHEPGIGSIQAPLLAASCTVANGTTSIVVAAGEGLYVTLRPSDNVVTLNANNAGGSPCTLSASGKLAVTTTEVGMTRRGNCVLRTTPSWATTEVTAALVASLKNE